MDSEFIEVARFAYKIVYYAVSGSSREVQPPLKKSPKLPLTSRLASLTRSITFTQSPPNPDFVYSTNLLADNPELQAPHGLALFEDHIYYLVANSFRLSRCSLYGQKHCETYVYRVFDANTFVVRHESAQRDDVADACAGAACGHVCAPGEGGGQCVCDDGFAARGGACRLVNKDHVSIYYYILKIKYHLFLL